jgi:hypothetical protein
VKGALQTLSAFAGTPLSADTVGLVSSAFALGACVFSAWLILRRHQDSRMDYALAIMTMLVMYPVLESIHMVLALIPMLILLGTAFEARTVPLSAIGPKLEMLLGAFAVLLLFFSARFVSYTVAMLIIYGLCLARYFSPSMRYRRSRVRQLA